MRKKTHEEYVNEVLIKNPSVDVVGTYINSNTKITHRCKICEHEWEAFPLNVLKGCGCPNCANDKRSKAHALTADEYISRLASVNSHIEFIGDYKSQSSKAMHRCKICGYEWLAYPSNVLAGKSCKKCFDNNNANNLRKSHDVYVEQVMCINNNVIVMGQYINARTPIKHKCKMCGHEWDVTPDSVLHGHGCPVCAESNGEKIIKNYLCLHSIEFEQQYTFYGCKNKKSLRFDFYIPSLNACIEYDGIQHFEPVEHFGGMEALKKRQYNDSIKDNYCLSNQISLLRIKYNQNVNNELDNFFNNKKIIKEAV